MKVHGSQSSHYTAPLLNQSSTDSDDDTPFTLPDDDSDQKATAAPVSSTSSSTSSIANSISSSFWANQSGSTTTNDTLSAADGTGTADDSASGDLSSDDILSEFAKWANMTPAEKIRAQYLEQQNLTEEQFAQLPSDQQKAINDQIADQIKQQLGAKSGSTDEDEGSGAVSLG